MSLAFHEVFFVRLHGQYLRPLRRQRCGPTHDLRRIEELPRRHRVPLQSPALERDERRLPAIQQHG